MKTLKNLMQAIAVALLILPLQIHAQEDQRPEFVVMTKVHRDLAYEDGSGKEWMDLEKEYFEKVTKQNEFMVGTAVFTHRYTADNSEMLRVTAYANWEAIEKAQDRTGELVEAGWPDEGERKAFFEKRNAYFLNVHSDEIYRTVPGAKFPTGRSEEPKIIYMQKRHGTMPEGGSVDEINALNNQYLDAVIKPNDLVLGYFPLRHGWGSDNREMIDIFMYDSLADLDASNARNTELIEAHWPDESKRDAYFDKLESYETGWHADFIYASIPALSK